MLAKEKAVSRSMLLFQLAASWHCPWFLHLIAHDLVGEFCYNNVARQMVGITTRPNLWARGESSVIRIFKRIE